MRRPLGQRLVEMGVVVLAVALFLSEAWLFHPPGESTISVSISITTTGSVAFVNSTARGRPGTHLSEAYLWSRTGVAPEQIVYYYQSGYPVNHADVTDWYGLPQHLESVASFRGSSLPILTVNATGLAAYLRQVPVPGQVLVLASGVLPYTVFGPSQNLLLSWMRAGGTAVWVGGAIGYFSGSGASPTSCPLPANPATGGTLQFLNASLLSVGGAPPVVPCPGEMTAAFLNSSTISQALGVSYPYSLPMDDLNLGALASENGTVLGNLRDGQTNVGAIPEGSGRLIYFGGPLVDVSQFAIELLNLLTAGMVSATSVLLASVSLVLGSSGTAAALERVPLAGSLPVPGHLCVLSTQTDYLAEFEQMQCN